MFAILKHFVPKKVNFTGMGVFIVFVENPEGRGGYRFLEKKWKMRGGGVVLSELPSVLGVWIFSGTTLFKMFNTFDNVRHIRKIYKNTVKQKYTLWK